VLQGFTVSAFCPVITGRAWLFASIIILGLFVTLQKRARLRFGRARNVQHAKAWTFSWAPMWSRPKVQGVASGRWHESN